MLRYILMSFTLFTTALAFAFELASSQVGPPAKGQVGPPDGPPAADEVQLAFEKQLASPLFKPAIDYDKIARLPNCRDEVTRGLRYHNCRDSREIYTAALAAAKAQDKPLVIVFGFNRCPYCAVLHKQIFNPARPMRDANLVRYFSKPAVETYGQTGESLALPYIYIHARSDHGLKLADDLGVTALAKARGWHRVWSPFVVFVNSETEVLASQNYWEAPETHCDPIADFAANLEELGMIEKGSPVTPRKRCQRKS